jgi:hypothetical protein
MKMCVKTSIFTTTNLYLLSNRDSHCKTDAKAKRGNPKKMLGSNPELLRLWHWQPDALTTRLDLMHMARSHPHMKKFLSQENDEDCFNTISNDVFMYLNMKNQRINVLLHCYSYINVLACLYMYVSAKVYVSMYVSELIQY